MMIQLTIDGRTVTAPPGTTLYQAAQQVGIPIPALCYIEDSNAGTMCAQEKGCGAACRVCLVKVDGRLTPSCCTKAQNAMVVESETEDVHAARRTAIELLLSHHRGDCFAPCEMTCPAHLPIPNMLRLLQKNKITQAAQLAHRHLIFPASLGQICFQPCERACRRSDYDQPLAIRQLHRFAALSQNQDTTPPQTDSDNNTAQSDAPPITHSQKLLIIGSCPAGIAAAVELRALGYPVHIIDQTQAAGGILAQAAQHGELKQEALTNDLTILDAWNITRQTLTPLTIDQLCQNAADHDILIIADRDIDDTQLRLTVNKPCFVIENAQHPLEKTVHAVAAGKQFAQHLHASLQQQPTPKRRFNSRLGKLAPHELHAMLAAAEPHPRYNHTAASDTKTQPDTSAQPDTTPQPDTEIQNTATAQKEAQRCLHCDCRKLQTCALRQAAQHYHAQPNRYPAIARPFHLVLEGPYAWEPGKCIVCGRCVELTQHNNGQGMIFVQRGIHQEVVPSPDTSLTQALGDNAQTVIDNCPTAALAWTKSDTNNPTTD